MRTAALIPILFTLAFCRPLHAGAYLVTALGTLGGSNSAAFGINDLGQVVGSSITAGGQTHAFLYSDGVMIDLGVLSPSDNFSQAFRINDNGQVVGKSATADSHGLGGGSREPHDFCLRSSFSVSALPSKGDLL